MASVEVDVPTLFLVGFAFSVVATVFLATAWFGGKAYPGLGLWLVASACSVLAGPLFAARGAVPLLLSAFVASGLSVAAYVTLLAGLHRFTGTRWAGARPTAALLTLAGAAFFFFLYARPSVGARVAIYAACTSILAAQIAHHCARGFEREYRLHAGVLAAIFATHVVAQGLRGATALVTTLNGVDPGLFRRSPLETLLLVVAVAGASVVPFALPALHERRLFLELERSNARVRTLEGILPICMHCKRIRDGGDAWHPVESYISSRTEAAFSHGICPSCLAEHYPEDDDGAA
jgi:hypothetical protein